MENRKITKERRDDVSQIIVEFHKKVKDMFDGRSMIDGYTVTIRDAIEAANFVNHFADSIGLAESLIFGITRQYIEKLKNDDKPEVIEILKEINFAGLCDSGTEPDVDEILYLGGKSQYANQIYLLDGREENMLGNLFRVLTRNTPKVMQNDLETLYELLVSDKREVLVPAVKTLAFLPDSLKKVIIELGIDLYNEETEVFIEFLQLAALIKDEEWKKEIIENHLFPNMVLEPDDNARDKKIETVKLLADNITDDLWKKKKIDESLIPQLTSPDINTRIAATGLIWALAEQTGDDTWRKEVIENTLFQVLSDIAGPVAAWCVKAIGVLSLGLSDCKWKEEIIRNQLQAGFFHKYESVRAAAVSATGAILAKFDDEALKKGIIENYLLEKLFDTPNVQLAVMDSLYMNFATMRDEEWKKRIIEKELLPKLRTRRESQVVVISRIEKLLLYIKSEKWKEETIETFFFPKLKNRDWFIHSEALKMLGSLNQSIDNGKWKQKVVEEQLAPALISYDLDIQAAAALAVGELTSCTGSEQWRKEIIEEHLLPKSLSDEDNKVRTALFNATGKIATAIDDNKWRKDLVKDYFINNHRDNGRDQAVTAEANCRIISLQLAKNVETTSEIFQKNLEKYLSKDSSDMDDDEILSDNIKETDDSVTIGRFTIRKSTEISPHIPDKLFSTLINTRTTVADLEFLAASVIIDKPVLEIGPTATRKSALIQYLASLTNTPYRRFNLNGQTDKYEFIGGYKPKTVSLNLEEAKAVINQTIKDSEHETIASAVTRLTGEKYSNEASTQFVKEALENSKNDTIINIAVLILSGESRLEWQDGILIDALKKGYYLNLDELNLSETEVLERINSLLDDEQSIVVYEHENEKYIKESAYEEQIVKYLKENSGKTRDEACEYLKEHKIFKIDKNFRMFATMNPKEYKGRNKLSDPFLNRWRILRIEELPDEEIAEIIKANYNIQSELLLPIILFHQSIREQAEKGILGKPQREEYHFTIRDLKRVFDRVNIQIENRRMSKEGFSFDTEAMKSFLAEAVHEVYGMVFRDEEDQKKYSDFFKKVFGTTAVPEEYISTEDLYTNYVRTAGHDTVTIGIQNGVSLPVFKGNKSPHIPGSKSTLTHVRTTLNYLRRVAQSVRLGEPVHLVGPTASAKTSIVRYLAYLTNSGFQRVSLAGQTDTADIIGQYQATNIRGQYNWQDGTLLKAMKKGDYLLLDELNLAEPQILERLNSLLDTGKIVISEHDNETYVNADLYEKMISDGKIERNDIMFVKTHKNFRIIAASNPIDTRHHGRTRLSLAFRNRFREMWMDEIEDNSELSEIVANVLNNEIH